MYTPHTITVINVIRTQKSDYTEVKNIRATVLDGVMVNAQRSSTPSQNGASRYQSTKVFIPKSVRAEAFEEYVSAAEYNGASGTWSLRPCGDSTQVDCYIVKGRVTGNLDYKSLKMRGAEVYDVISVIDCDFGSADMRHWEVECR